jgi:hypothetical protein
MDNYMIPFILRDALLCLVFLIGLGLGVVAITRKQPKIGAFILAGFFLLGLDPMAEMLIFNVLSPNLGNSDNYLAFNWAYVCISVPATVLGTLSVLAALYFALQPAAPKDAGPSNEPISMGDKTQVM